MHDMLLVLASFFRVANGACICRGTYYGYDSFFSARRKSSHARVIGFCERVDEIFFFKHQVAFCHRFRRSHTAYPLSIFDFSDRDVY